MGRNAWKFLLEVFWFMGNFNLRITPYETDNHYRPCACFLYLIYMITLVYRKKILKYTIEVYDRFLCFLGWGIRFCHRFSSISSRFCCIESGYFFISIEIKNFIFWKKWIFIKSMIVSYVFWGEEFDYHIYFYVACLDFA